MEKTSSVSNMLSLRCLRDILFEMSALQRQKRREHRTELCELPVVRGLDVDEDPAMEIV